MRTYDAHWPLESIARDMRRRARYGTYDGNASDPCMVGYIERCKALHRPTGSVLLFTRDAGAHDHGM